MRQACLAVVLLVFVGCLSSVFGQTASGGVCQGQVGNFKYNLQALSTATGGNDQQCQDQGGNTYYYRPCQALQQQACQTISDPTPAACQKDTRKIPQYHDCGSTSQVVWSARPAGANTGFFIQFNGGEEDRRLDIEFICDKSAGTGQIQAANPSEQPTHFYHLEWRTEHACPGGGGDGGDGGGGGDGDDGPAISGGWIFIIILLSLFVLYIIGGVAYNKFRKDAHGLELIPNHEFWFALPGLVKDGHVYTWRKLRGLCGARYEEM